MISRDTSSPSLESPGLLGLPAEVLEQVYQVLNIPDRLRLLRTCKLLNGIYRDSSPLAYDFSLYSLAYLDVPRRLLPQSDEDLPTDSESESDDEPSSSSRLRTGAPRAGLTDSLLSEDDIEQALEGDLDESHPAREDNLHETGTLADDLTLRQQLEALGLPFHSDRDSAVPKDPHSIASRNARLLERERRWEELDPKEIISCKVKGPAGVYELQEGIFLLCDNYMGPMGPGTGKPISIRLFKLPNADTPSRGLWGDIPRFGAQAQYNPSRIAKYLSANGRDNAILQQRLRLDSHMRRMETYEGEGAREELPFEIHTLGFSIADLTMDPTQDLIVVSEYNPDPPSKGAIPPPHRLHLLSMSTFKSHPLAFLPTLDFPPFTQIVGSTRQLLQVMDDILIVMVSRYAALWLGNVIPHIPGMESEEQIVVWNWKTGEVISRMALPENGWFSSLALLTPTSFMITSTSSISPIMSAGSLEPRSIAAIFPPVIQIYSFLPDPKNQTFPIQPLSTEHTDDSTARPVLLAQLELPRFSDRVIVSSFDVRPDPAFPPRQANDDGRSYGGHAKSFTQDPSKGLLVFDLDVMEAPSETAFARRRWPHKAYELFVLREKLIEYAHQGEERLRQSREEAAKHGWGIHRVEEIIPWATWGVPHSRLLDVSMKRRAWVCSCSGYRFVSLVRDLFSPRDADDPNNSDDSDDDDNMTLQDSRMPHIQDVRILDFSPFAVRKELSRHQAILHDGEYPYRMPPAMDLAEAIATEGFYDDHAHGIRITETPSTDGPKYEIWRSIHDSVWKRVVSAPTILPKRRVFQEDVDTRLPYVETVRMEGVWSNGVMMDDQRIMIISTEEFRGSPPKVEQKMTILCM